VTSRLLPSEALVLDHLVAAALPLARVEEAVSLAAAAAVAYPAALHRGQAEGEVAGAGVVVVVGEVDHPFPSMGLGHMVH